MGENILSLNRFIRKGSVSMSPSFGDSVRDPDHFDTDPGPTFHFDIAPNPDPTE